MGGNVEFGFFADSRLKREMLVFLEETAKGRNFEINNKL